MMPSHHFCHNFNWVLGIKTLARPNIELIGNAVQLLLSIPRQVCALGQVLPDHAMKFSLLLCCHRVGERKSKPPLSCIG